MRKPLVGGVVQLIQNNLFDENGYKRLVESLERLELDHKFIGRFEKAASRAPEEFKVAWVILFLMVK